MCEAYQEFEVLLDYNWLDVDSVTRPGQRLRIPSATRAHSNHSE
jgi:hypothetical protein